MMSIMKTFIDRGLIMQEKYRDLKSENTPNIPKSNSGSSRLKLKKKPYSPPTLIPLSIMK